MDRHRARATVRLDMGHELSLAVCHWAPTSKHVARTSCQTSAISPAFFPGAWSFGDVSCMSRALSPPPPCTPALTSNTPSQSRSTYHPRRPPSSSSPRSTPARSRRSRGPTAGRSSLRSTKRANRSRLAGRCMTACTGGACRWSSTSRKAITSSTCAHAPFTRSSLRRAYCHISGAIRQDGAQNKRPDQRRPRRR